MYVRDSYDEFVLHEAEQLEKLKQGPICCCCQEAIMEDVAICYNGDWYCDDCEDAFIDVMRQEYRERVII